MDPKGNIYEGDEENPVKPEDAARLDGYLKARAEADLKKELKEALRRHERSGIAVSADNYQIVREVVREWSDQPECDKLGSHEEEELTDRLLSDAYPAIHQAVEQEFIERLVSDEAVRAGTIAALKMPVDSSEDLDSVTRAAIEAAISATSEQGV